MPYAKPSILQSWRRAGGYERTSRREITVAPHSDPEHSEVGTWSAGMNKDSSEFVRRGRGHCERFEGRRRGGAPLGVVTCIEGRGSKAGEVPSGRVAGSPAVGCSGGFAGSDFVGAGGVDIECPDDRRLLQQRR
jgi:hypothetical protein